MVEQRVTDGFINGTMMCVAHGKDMSDWLKTDGTWDLVTALAKDLEIGSAQSKNHKSGNSVFTRVTATYPDLVTSKRGSPDTGGGVWLHPDRDRVVELPNKRWKANTPRSISSQA